MGGMPLALTITVGNRFIPEGIFFVTALLGIPPAVVGET